MSPHDPASVLSHLSLFLFSSTLFLCFFQYYGAGVDLKASPPFKPLHLPYSYSKYHTYMSVSCVYPFSALLHLCDIFQVYLCYSELNYVIISYRCVVLNCVYIQHLHDPPVSYCTPRLITNLSYCN